MHIFGPTKYRSNDQLAADRKSLASSLSSSVKSLFHKRSRRSSTATLTAEDLSFEPSMIETIPRAAVSKRRSAMVGVDTIRHKISTRSLRASEDTESPLSLDRYSQARARVLAETIRRLQQTSSPPPVTPSSISTGKTLPCFPEVDEHEESDYEPHCAGISTNGRANAVPRVVSDSSASSSRTCVPSSRPTSVASFTSSEGSSVGRSYPSRKAGCTSRETLDMTKDEQLVSQEPARSTKPDGRETKRHYAAGARYSVAMAQNVGRRFQTRLAHEYEQRIYSLHTHYSDMIERMEERARSDSDRLAALQREADELRQANAMMRIRESELQLKCRSTADSSIRALRDSPDTLPPKKIVAFIEHYQEEILRQSRETATAQEWVITLAELVIGPKKERQSWDDWLNLCLDTLQKHREQQCEQEWLRKINPRTTV
ncbi:hypothetical protein GGF46_003483 [Coemansia sp. RSA 552]|nr:hypothetical protein GGF46_003483 [Coemansia sp. RSA 552]